MTYAELSSTGPVRPKNEDFLGFVQPSDVEEQRTRGAVVAIADGVGGTVMATSPAGWPSRRC
jgi:serine/threonine protein phosphatase PrpC